MTKILPFLFLDLETTGLDPYGQQIIEIAAGTVDQDFEIVEFFEAVIFTALGEACWEPPAAAIHRASGLMEEVKRGKLISSVCGDFLQWLDWVMVNQEIDRLNLAGNSIHFDRGFLNVHMPEVLPRLTHRHLDVSSFRLLGQAIDVPEFKADRPHRARADLERTLAELAHYRKELGNHYRLSYDTAINTLREIK